MNYYILLNKLSCWLFIIQMLFQLLSCTPSPNDSKKTYFQKARPLGNMVLIPEGEFLMGTNDADARADEKPSHKIYLSAYYIDRYEVTNSEYQQFVLETGHQVPFLDREWACDFNWNGINYPSGKADYPVVLVSWTDATAYAHWAGKRLPTESEWEKASRAGFMNQKYPFGNSIDLAQANYKKGYLRSWCLMPVGSYQPNQYGLFDMSGNVWEWCHDWYSDDYYSKSFYMNPAGPSEGYYRVIRGGAWINDPEFLTCSHRGKSLPDEKSFAVGFRCSLSCDEAHKP